MPFPDENPKLVLGELEKNQKLTNKDRSILSVKKHLQNQLLEPLENIEILCKNFPVADAHSLQYVQLTKWQNKSKVMVLHYKRKNEVKLS